MDLNDARAFVIPRGKHNGQTIQAAASGHLDAVREMLDEEESGTEFRDALETFVSWADSEPQDDADVPPEPEEETSDFDTPDQCELTDDGPIPEKLVDGELDENGDVADPEAYE